jgi:zinc transport system substrate-binding protein
VKTRIVLTLGLVLVLGTAAFGCGEDEGAGAAGATEVVAGFYPLAFAAQEVGGTGVEVTNLTPAGAEPHDLELTPRELEEILEADLVLYAGGGFQPALEEAVAGADVRALDVLEGLELRAGDPHVWLDPTRFARIVEQIGAALGADPAARRLADRLRALDEEFRSGLADCDRRELVTAHDAFGYLAERYDLEPLPITGVSPEAEPNPGEVEAVADLVDDRGVTTIFVEPLLSPEIGETVARETGAKTASLDPLEGLSEDQLAAGEDYFSVMEANLEALRDGLGCR